MLLVTKMTVLMTTKIDDEDDDDNENVESDKLLSYVWPRCCNLIQCIASVEGYGVEKGDDICYQ